MRPLGIYVHFPYCPSICPYCDFAVAVSAHIPHERYANAVIAELAARAEAFAGRRAVSLYFGGGTPSLWAPAEVARVVAAARSLYALPPDAEVTLEANPGAADAARLAAYRAAGVNRVSLGVQSFSDASLRALGREHTGAEASAAFAAARDAGFDNVTLDLMHGDATQTAAGAQADAARAVALGPEHISNYALTLTALAVDVPMARDVRRGRLSLPDDEAQASMGGALRETLAAGGYRRYEVSNYARPGREAVHNALYWTGAEYVAAGVGAAGFWRDPSGPAARRWTNERTPLRYLAAVERGERGLAEAMTEDLAPDDLLRERLFTGLRLVAGLDLAALEDDLGVSVRERFVAALDGLVRDALATYDGRRLALTERGLDFHAEASLRFF